MPLARIRMSRLRVNQARRPAGLRRNERRDHGGMGRLRLLAAECSAHPGRNADTWFWRRPRQCAPSPGSRSGSAWRNKPRSSCVRRELPARPAFPGRSAPARRCEGIPRSDARAGSAPVDVAPYDSPRLAQKLAGGDRLIDRQSGRQASSSSLTAAAPPGASRVSPARATIG